jgi:hypothetical protein
MYVVLVLSLQRPMLTPALKARSVFYSRENNATEREYKLTNQ